MARSTSSLIDLDRLESGAAPKTARVQPRKHHRDRKAVCIEALEGRRFLSAGVLDTTFGAGGKVASSILGNDAAIQSDGKIVVTSTKIGHNGVYDLVLVRYNSNG